MSVCAEVCACDFQQPDEVGIGPETAGVTTFSQRPTEQRVISHHERRAQRFRGAPTGIPDQINILNSKHFPDALEMCAENGK